MPRKKVMYNYWELPEWDYAKIVVVDCFTRNNKKKMILEDGANKYTINRPKRKEWMHIKKDDFIYVSKELLTQRRALLHLHAVNENPIHITG